MKRTLLVIGGLLFSCVFYAQVGINTTSPKATLDIHALDLTGTAPEGFIAPRLTGNVLHVADTNSKYGADQNGALAYITAPPQVSNQVGQTIDIDEEGYYYFDSVSNKWVKFRAVPIQHQILT